MFRRWLDNAVNERNQWGPSFANVRGAASRSPPPAVGARGVPVRAGDAVRVPVDAGGARGGGVGGGGGDPVDAGGAARREGADRAGRAVRGVDGDARAAD